MLLLSTDTTTTKSTIAAVVMPAYEEVVNSNHSLHAGQHQAIVKKLPVTDVVL